MVFVESPIFTADVKALLSDEEYAALQDHLASQPDAGDLIKQTGGLRKVRWRLKGSGKRGGTMNKRLFERLVESMQQHEEIRRRERPPSREFFVDAEKVKEIRAMTGLRPVGWRRP